MTAGCGGSSTGTAKPVPEQMPVDNYRDLMSPADRTTLEYIDTIRPLDPCGFLDDGAVHRIGAPVYFGVGADISSCEALYEPGAGPKKIDKVTVDLAGAPEPNYGTPVDVGGVRVRTSPTPDFCTAYVPLNAKQDVAYTVYPKGDFLHPVAVDVCPEVIDLVAASLPALHSGAPRTASQKGGTTPLGRLDPCSAIRLVGRGHDPHLVGGSFQMNPAECDFWLDGEDDDTRQHVFLETGSDVFFLQNPDDHTVLRKIGGVTVIEKPSNSRQYPNYCEFYAGVGQDKPFTRPDITGEGAHQWFDMIHVTGADGCDKTRATVEESIRLYKKIR